MSFKVRLEPKAVAVLLALEDDHEAFVQSHLERLSESPHTLSRTAVTPPYPPDGMTYEFELYGIPLVHRFTIFFRYSQDEETLVVSFVGHYSSLIPGLEADWDPGKT